MDAQRLHDLLAAGKDGIQGAQAVLKHHGNILAAHLLHLPFGELEQIHPVKEDLAFVVHEALFIIQTHDALARDGFAAAGLAHEAEDLAFSHIKRHALHSVHHAALGTKRCGEVLDFQYFFCHDRTSSVRVRVENVPQTVAENVCAHHGQRRGKAGIDDHPPGARDDLSAVREDVAPARLRGGHAHAEEAQRGLGDDGVGEVIRRLHHDDREDVRRDMTPDDARGARTLAAQRFDVGLLLYDEGGRARDARHARDVHDAQCQDDVEKALPQHRHQGDGEQR